MDNLWATGEHEHVEEKNIGSRKKKETNQQQTETSTTRQQPGQGEVHGSKQSPQMPGAIIDINKKIVFVSSLFGLFNY
jgi:hypothetical protein